MGGVGGPIILGLLTYRAAFTNDKTELVVINPVQPQVIIWVRSCDGSGQDNVDTKLSDAALELRK